MREIDTRQMIRRGLESAYGTLQEAARHLSYSPDMLSKIFSGKRNIAQDIKNKMARIHPLAGLALAAEATGYSWFVYQEGDRHPQNLTQVSLYRSEAANAAIRDVSRRIINKTAPEHLQADDTESMRQAARLVSDRIRSDINLLLELDERYKIGLLDQILPQSKFREARLCIVKTPRTGSRRAKG